MYVLSQKKILVGASLSCANLCELRTELKRLENAGIDYIHYDVIDGRFNDTFILGIPTLKAIRPHTKLPIEVHLAVYKPEKFIGQFIKAGADYIAFHYEETDKPQELCKRILALHARPILAFRVETDIDERVDLLLPMVDWVLKLTVNPGYSGQKFQKAAVSKIHQLKDRIKKCHVSTKIAADGNINENTIPEVVKAGGTMLVGGSSGLFVPSLTLKKAKQRMFDVAVSYLDG
jgi:ribulose-phosphate 3-epimerase